MAEHIALKQKKPAPSNRAPTIPERGLDAEHFSTMFSAPQAEASGAFARPAPTAGALRRSAVSQLQQSHGNAYVAHMLAQRDPAPTTAPAAPSSGEAQQAGGEAAGAWLQGEIYDLLKKELGEQKLKEQAAKLAGKGADLLMAYVKDATSKDDFVQKAQVKEMGKLLEQDLQIGITSLLKSPEGERARAAILKAAKSSPDAAIGMALLGLALMIAANAEIPKLDQSLEVHKNLKLKGSAELGSFRDIALKQIKASLEYTRTSFQATVGAGYSDQKGGAGQANASMKAGEFSFSTTGKLGRDGRLHLDLTSGLDLKQFGLTGAVGLDSVDSWVGSGQLRLGDKQDNVTTKVTFGGDGKLGFDFNTNLSAGRLGIKGGGGAKMSSGWDVNEVKITAGLQYRVTGDQQNTQKPFIVLKVDSQFTFSDQQPKPDAPASQPNAFQGTVILEGRF